MESLRLYSKHKVGYYNWLLALHNQAHLLRTIIAALKTELTLLTFIIFTLLLIAPLNGQSNNIKRINTSELWADMTLNKPIAEKWAIGGDFGIRTALSDTKFWLFYLRPNVNFKPAHHLKFTLGLGSFNAFSDELFNTYEIRVYQDALVHWPKLGLFNFSHRFRLEERFFSYSEASIDNDFRFRGRYLLGVRTDGFSLGGAPNWTVFGSVEPFFRLNGKDNFAANNFRWDTALCYQANNKLRIELHYILQSSEFFFDNTQSLENIFRIRVFQDL